MALKTLLVDGQLHAFTLERGSNDGGLVVNYMSPDTGVIVGLAQPHVSWREWFQDSSLAQAEYDTIDDVRAREKRLLAVAQVQTAEAQPAK